MKWFVKLLAFALFASPAYADLQYIVGEAGQVTIVGLSSDVKPTIANGAVFLESDTAKFYLRTGGAWVESTNIVYAPSSADYLVGTANGTLTGEIAVGTSPGGELGNTWASPTLDDSITVTGWTMGASVATTPSANDNDTSLATSAFVQGELDDIDNLSDNCAVENDSTPVPDSCVGNGSDADTDTTNFDADGDNNSPQTINAADELLIAGGTNGVDTVASATDTVMINLDLSESAAGGELGGNLDAPTLDDSVTVTGWVMGASTATSPAADDNDTSLATSAFVQSEIDDGDNLTNNCVLENDGTPIPDSCVGDGSDAGGSYSFNADGDNNSPQTISDTNELLIAGGTNGIDTVASATDTVTLNLDLSESAAGGELGGNLDAPTLDDTIGVTDWTLTSPNVAAGSATASSWPNFTDGTVLTAAEDGALELDANVLYFTTDAGNRGYVPVRNVIRANATHTLPNDTAENPIFTAATDRITLETGTYIFKALIGVTGMSATSGNALIDILGAGTATVNDWLWSAVGKDGTLIGVAAVQGVMPVIQSTPASMFTAGTGTELWAVIDGTFTVTVAGTMIPSIDLVTASAAVVAIGSYFMVERIGDTSLTNIGQVD